jgi:hypothetical protein
MESMFDLFYAFFIGIFHVTELIMAWFISHIGLLVSLIWFIAVGKVTLWIIAKMLWPVAKPLSTAPRKPILGPPDGMNKEAWVIRELTKLPEIIAQAELEAEHQWRVENDEHDECSKCAAKKVAERPAKIPSAAIMPQKKVTACDPPRLAVRVQRAPYIFHEMIVHPHPILDRVDIVDEFGPNGEYVCVHKGIPSVIPKEPFNFVGETIAIVRVRAGATSILDTDITSIER